MFTFQKGNQSVNDFVSYFYLNHELTLVAVFGILFATPIYPYIESKFKNPKFQLLRYTSIIMLLVLSIVYVAAGSYNPFIYFKF